MQFYIDAYFFEVIGYLLSALGSITPAGAGALRLIFGLVRVDTDIK